MLKFGSPVGQNSSSISGDTTLNSSELARKIIELAEEKQASAITLLDLREISVLADYFVICTSDSTRQTKAILDSIASDLKKEDILPLRPPEGKPDAGWTLLDYGDVVVHVFNESTRQFYDLEQLWKDAQVVLKIQ
ncbi:MAG: ribosome silencing factor [Chloroflexota bacterium]|nr:ribosome silencing factor [Chloroflexota bacterium]